jgi:hypothetical protein
VRPHTGQSGICIFQLGQLDLEFGLSSLCPRGEYVQNQLAAVEDLDFNNLFKLADLAWGKVIIKYHNVGFESPDSASELVGFTLTYVCGRIYSADFLLESVHDNSAGTFSQGCKLSQIVRSIGDAEDSSDQNRPFFSDS